MKLFVYASDMGKVELYLVTRSHSLAAFIQ